MSLGIEHDRRRHRRKRTFARRDRVGRTLDEPEHVRRSRFAGEIVHLVVEQHARAGGDETAAEAVVQRVGDVDRVAGRVDDAIVGRVLALVAAEAGDLRRRRRAIHIDRRAHTPEVIRRQERIDGRRHEIGIAERRIAIGERAAFRFEFDVRRLRVAKRARPGMPDDAEDFAQRDAAGTGRRRGHDRVARVAAGQRLALDGAIIREVGEGDDSTRGLQRSDEGVGDRSAVETVDAAF